MGENIVTNEKMMQDIPLNESNLSKDNHWDEHKLHIKEKTNSLKRFFKKSLRLHSDSNGESSVSQQDLRDFDDTNMSETYNSDGEVQQEQRKKRSLFRSGGLQRHPGLTNLNRDSQIEVNATSSKLSLKHSLSTYWNFMFKKNKKNKSSANNTHDFEVRDANVQETLNNNSNDLDAQVDKIANSVLNEEVHSVKLSEDNNDYN